MTLTSSGGITDTGAHTISGSSLQVSAANGVGSASAPLLTAVSSLQVTNSTSGDVAVSNTGDLTVSDIGTLGYGLSQQAFTGSVYLNSSGALTVSAPVQVSGTTGNVALNAGTGISVDGAVSVPTGGTVGLLTSTGDITQSAPITATYASAAATTGNVTLNNESNNIGTVAISAGGTSGIDFESGIAFSVGNVGGIGGSIPALSGMSATGVSSGYAIQMQTANGFRAITIGATVDGGSADVLINSSAQILQSTGGQINANALSLVSAADVGSSSTPLLVNTSLLNASSSGGVYVTNNGPALGIGSITASNGVVLYSSGTMTLAPCKLH